MIPANVGFIDLETLPGDATVGMETTAPPGWEDPDPEPKEVTPRVLPRNMKKGGDAAARWKIGEEKRLEQAQKQAQLDAVAAVDAQRASALSEWRKGSLDPLRGRIALIALAFGEGDVQVIDCAEDEEAGLRELGGLIVDAKPRTWVAHNGPDFDFPFLQLRALKYGSAVLASRFHQEKSWDGVLVDTADWWPTVGGWGGRKRGTRLDVICTHLGIERTDNPIGGAEVLDAYIRGDWPHVVQHGVADVRDMREVYRTLVEVRRG